MTSNLSVLRNQLHVVFVDHELNRLYTASLMEACQYRVTHFQLAGDALSMLTNGNTKIDLIIANIISSDVGNLLQLAVSMEIPTILMSNDDNPSMAMSVLENGAFLYIKRPSNPEMLRYLWQDVARETMRVMRERERLAASYITPPCGIEFWEMENPNNLFNVDKGKRKRNDYNEKFVENEQSFDNSMMSQGNVKRKMCIHWTSELRKKFDEACYQLGNGNIFPIEIVKKMNVHGLTRMQVASHLQKMRLAGGEDPESTQTDPKSSEGKRSNNKRKRFGLMPRILVAKFKERVHNHSSNSEMEGLVTESGMVTEIRMANQPSDGEGSSHKPSGFGSMPEIMKDKSKDRVGDHGSRSDQMVCAGMANQPTCDNLQNETFNPNLENIAQDKHSFSSHLSFDDYSLFQ